VLPSVGDKLSRGVVLSQSTFHLVVLITAAVSSIHRQVLHETTLLSVEIFYL